jgi:hypothetical protein
MEGAKGGYHVSKLDAVRLFESMVEHEDNALELEVVMEELGASAHDMLYQAYMLVRAAQAHDDFSGDEEGNDTASFDAMLKGHEAWSQSIKALDALDKAATYSAPDDSYLARMGLRC